MKEMRLAALLGLCLFITGACTSKPEYIREARPEEMGMDPIRLGRLDAVVNTAVSRGDFPGAVILVARRGRVVFRKAYGYSRWIPFRRPMTVDTIFDMASITKPSATAPSILVLVEQGRLRLWDPVTEYIPGFKPFVSGEEGEDKTIDDTRIWHLLTHTSGLPSYTDARELRETYGDFCPTDILVDYISRLDKISAPGEEFHYSCLGYITLAHIIHQISGYDVAEFASKYIYAPLGMTDTFFTPAAEYFTRCAPTELWKGVPLTGVVHDPLARLQGGVSGNAGLFSTADDLLRYAMMLLNKGKFNKARILSPLAVERMTEIYSRSEFAGRGLGWDLESDYSTNGGDLFGADSFGHTGYTGTSLWIDPDTGTVVIFLTNRVHPVDEGAVISTRSRVANVVSASILDP